MPYSPLRVARLLLRPQFVGGRWADRWREACTFGVVPWARLAPRALPAVGAVLGVLAASGVGLGGGLVAFLFG